MQSEVRALYSETVRAAVAAAVGAAPDAMRDVGGFESFVHAVDRPSGTVYVKATWDGRRTVEQLRGELAFVEHLSQRGASVARTAPLTEGRMVASVPAEGCSFLVTAFEEAPGEVRTREQWTEAHFVAWGRLVGQLHRATLDYVEPAGSRRPTWIEEHRDLSDVIEHAGVRAAYQRLFQEVSALPITASTYGMCHTDLHRYNVHWVGTSPTAIDFDDAVAFWFATDLAIVLYYALVGPVFHGGDRQADFETLLPLLREGYEAEHQLPQEAWDTIPLFMRLREAVLWIVTMRSIPPRRRSPEMQERFDACLPRILADEPAYGLRF